MKLNKGKTLSDFVSYRGEYSSGRLISLVGSTVVLILLILNPTNAGLQQLTMAVLGYSFTATTVSKFAKNTSYDNQSTSPQEVWGTESEQSEPYSMGRSNGTGNRGDS